jgi:ferredoxin
MASGLSSGGGNRDVKVRVDPRLCVCSGSCTRLVPEVFAQSEDTGTVVLLNPDPPEDLQKIVGEAADICPSGAIEIVEAE